jgi:hypothetical protein
MWPKYLPVVKNRRSYCSNIVFLKKVLETHIPYRTEKFRIFLIKKLLPGSVIKTFAVKIANAENIRFVNKRWLNRKSPRDLDHVAFPLVLITASCVRLPVKVKRLTSERPLQSPELRTVRVEDRRALTTWFLTLKHLAAPARSHTASSNIWNFHGCICCCRRIKSGKIGRSVSLRCILPKRT